ncbi:MAG: PaaI family thioesterase [Myxococcales bacterium]|nr:PaaI family thioesterase [Myxococcales bacterium]USN50367.1 MAG: PaaI family thioesterase [Myxococcales bacterium]
MQSIQDQFAPHNRCFGCGPSNSKGLQIKSMVENDQFLAHFRPQEHHQAFDNILSGGICGTLLDCHSNWCAAYHIMKLQNMPTPPCTVTARYSVELLAPTPMDTELLIKARPISVSNKKAEIEAEIIAHDKITAKCKGLFVAVSEGHVAYHRW